MSALFPNYADARREVTRQGAERARPPRDGGGMQAFYRPKHGSERHEMAMLLKGPDGNWVLTTWVDCLEDAWERAAFLPFVEGLEGWGT